MAVTGIGVRGLCKRFGGTPAVDDLSFEVAPGTVCGFLGPNGAGKTTTLRILAGLVRPDAGSALIGGRPLAEAEHPASVAGAALEGFGFHPQRAARDHLSVLATRAGIEQGRVGEVLERVGLTERAGDPAGELSQGMRQRLALAGALLGRPRVLLLDEPANGLDPHGLRWLRDLLRDHAAGGGCALVSSHLLSELAQVADSVVVVHRGRLVTSGSLAAVARPGLRLRAPDRDALLAALRAAGVEAAVEDGAVLVPAADPDRVGRIVRDHGIVLHEMSPQSTLEATYLRLVAEGS